MRTMRFFILLGLCLVTFSKLLAQDDMQILAKDLRHSGGYFALMFKSSSFKDQSFVLMGGRGVWVINRAFGIGFEGNGIIPINSYEGIDPDGINKAILVGGYGGLVLEPILWSNKLVHITFPVSGGAGWLGYLPDWESTNYDPMQNNLYDDDIFWYIEPGASIELNVARFFRIGAGATRRFTQDLDLVNTNPSELDQFNFSLTLKFGSF
jgi:hypothetical protein